MNALQTFLRNTAFGIGIMMAPVAAGVAFRIASGTGMETIPVSRLLLACAIGGVATGFALTVLRVRR
jgi:hypothetical protein